MDPKCINKDMILCIFSKDQWMIHFHEKTYKNITALAVSNVYFIHPVWLYEWWAMKPIQISDLCPPATKHDVKRSSNLLTTGWISSIRSRMLSGYSDSSKCTVLAIILIVMNNIVSIMIVGIESSGMLRPLVELHRCYWCWDQVDPILISEQLWNRNSFKVQDWTN